MQNDPMSYLSRIGVPGGMSKAGEKAMKGTATSAPRMSSGQIPMPNARSLKVTEAKVKVMRPAPLNTGVKAGGMGSIETSESPKYEKLEKSTVGHFASPKNLRQGHNDGPPGTKRSQDAGMKMGGGLGKVFGKINKKTTAKVGKVGDGSRFKKMTNAIEDTGKSEASAKAIAASAGRKKYGNKKFQAMATAGKKRAMGGA